MSKVRQSLGEIPIVEDEMRKAAGEPSEGDAPAQQPTPSSTTTSSRVTADGTYATQSVFSAAVSSVKKEERPPLRKYVHWWRWLIHSFEIQLRIYSCALF